MNGLGSIGGAVCCPDCGTVRWISDVDEFECKCEGKKRKLRHSGNVIILEPEEDED